MIIVGVHYGLHAILKEDDVNGDDVNVADHATGVEPAAAGTMYFDVIVTVISVEVVVVKVEEEVAVEVVKTVFVTERLCTILGGMV